MALSTFSPNTKIKSAEINANFAGVIDMSLMPDGVIASRHIPSALISTSHIANSAITASKMGGIIVASGHMTSTVIVTTSWTDLISVTPTISKNNAMVYMHAFFNVAKITNAGWSATRIMVDGDGTSACWLTTASTDWWTGGSLFHQQILSSGSHTIKLQGRSQNSSSQFASYHAISPDIIASRLLIFEV